MIITATPQPENFPPRIRLDIDSGGDEFLDLTILRDGRPIRQQPAVMGLSETFVYDYEAPFGVPVTYSAAGSTTSGPWTTVLAETWASLSGWSTAYGSPSVSAGRLTGGEVSRDDIPLGANGFRITFPNEGAFAGYAGLWWANGSGRVGVTRNGLANLWFWNGDPSGSGAVAFTSVSPGSPLVLSVSADYSTVTLSQGAMSTTRPVIANRTAALFAMADGGSSLGPFTVEVPTSPVAVSADTSTQLDISEAWLIHPIQPSLSIPIERFSRGGEMSVAASTDETRTYASRQAIYQPNGRREAVSYPLGPRGAGSWTLVLALENIEARNDLMTLLDDQAPVLLRSPSEADWDLPDGWYSVGDVDVSRPIDIGGVELRRATLPLTKVAEPPVKIAPQLTWGDLMLRGAKWGDLLSKTWLQALMGEV